VSSTEQLSNVGHLTYLEDRRILVQMKQNFRTRDLLEVVNKEQAKVLLEDKTLQFLTPFMGIERSAEEAATLLNVNLNTTAA
jgi:hypothetical protein